MLTILWASSWDGSALLQGVSAGPSHMGLGQGPRVGHVSPTVSRLAREVLMVAKLNAQGISSLCTTFTKVPLAKASHRGTHDSQEAILVAVFHWPSFGVL